MTQKDTVLSVRLPRDLSDRLDRAVTELRLSKNDVARHAIMAAVEAIEAAGYRVTLPLEIKVVGAEAGEAPRVNPEAPEKRPRIRVLREGRSVSIFDERSEPLPNSGSLVEVNGVLFRLATKRDPLGGGVKVGPHRLIRVRTSVRPPIIRSSQRVKLMIDGKLYIVRDPNHLLTPEAHGNTADALGSPVTI